MCDVNKAGNSMPARPIKQTALGHIRQSPQGSSEEAVLEEGIPMWCMFGVKWNSLAVFLGSYWYWEWL